MDWLSFCLRLSLDGLIVGRRVESGKVWALISLLGVIFMASRAENSRFSSSKLGFEKCLRVMEGLLYNVS